MVNPTMVFDTNGFYVIDFLLCAYIVVSNVMVIQMISLSAKTGGVALPCLIFHVSPMVTR